MFTVIKSKNCKDLHYGLIRCFEITDEKHQEKNNSNFYKNISVPQNEAPDHKQAEFHTSIEESSAYTSSDLSPAILSKHLHTAYL